MTQAEIIDCGLDCEADSLAYVLARLLESALQEIKDIAKCETCSVSYAEVMAISAELSELMDIVQQGDLAEVNDFLRLYQRSPRQEPIE